MITKRMALLIVDRSIARGSRRKRLQKKKAGRHYLQTEVASLSNYRDSGVEHFFMNAAARVDVPADLYLCWTLSFGNHW